jgi:hypothetical protein
MLLPKRLLAKSLATVETTTYDTLLDVESVFDMDTNVGATDGEFKTEYTVRYCVARSLK